MIKAAATLLSFISLLIPWVCQAFEYSPNKDLSLSARGELSYALRFRTENQDPSLAPPFSGLPSGDLNFEKGDPVNNRVGLRMELELNAFSNLSFFSRGEAFFDHVYDDGGTFNQETREHAARVVNLYDFYGELFNRSSTLRMGKQVIRWGESVAAINAPAVNTVSPFDYDKILSAGYDRRDYQVPVWAAWAALEPLSNLALELVYAPDFEPRDGIPVVGTFSSTTDLLGYGATGIIDQRPDEFAQMQQYGLALRKTFPRLNNLELGLYYYHHLNHAPVLDMQTATYEEMDMVGASFSSIIPRMNIQVGGEVAYRPNALLQKEIKYLGESLPVGGYQRGRTLNWVVNLSSVHSDILPFLPWTFTLSNLMELNGGINLDHHTGYYAPKRRYYYFIQPSLETMDMIDNTTLIFSITAMGALHQAENSDHSQTFEIKAKYGDKLQMATGYEMRSGSNAYADRDALFFILTWFIF